MSIDAAKEIYEHIELFGKPALFSNFRIDKGTVPQELYCYDLRGSDNDPGIPISLERTVAINHAGCIIIAENIDLSDKGYIRIKGKLNFLGEHLSISDFCERYAICNKERFQIQPAANSDAGIFFLKHPKRTNRWELSVMCVSTLEKAVRTFGIPGFRAGMKVSTVLPLRRSLPVW